MLLEDLKKHSLGFCLNDGYYPCKTDAAADIISKYPEVKSHYDNFVSQIDSSIFKGKLNVYFCFNPEKRLLRMRYGPAHKHSAHNFCYAYRTLLQEFRNRVKMHTVEI